jgi:ribulose-5-phosphate 4-epimerase/fuculose-1-phosphate aldolase
MVRCEYEGDDKVIAHGAKPSVGGQSQRIIFKEHPDIDCIVHFHCPMNKDVEHIPLVSQKPYECGSVDCGKNCSDGLKQIGNLKVVMLDNHGPNIVFSKNTPAREVIEFIDQNFDLLNKTGGPVSLDNRTTGFTENMPAHLAKRFREEADKYIADRAE